MKITALVIALVQLFDIFLHAATNQLEPLRVSSNLIILLWLAITLLGRVNHKTWLAALISISTYLLLNLVFLAEEGITNPEQDGTLRVALLAFAFITITSSGLYTYLRAKPSLHVEK